MEDIQVQQVEVIQPMETVFETIVPMEQATPAIHATPPAPTGRCDSCGQDKELVNVEHNNRSWAYCARCKALHDKELAVNAGLKELAQTHPAQADTPQTARSLHNGMSVEDVKAELDRTRQPELEAEVIGV